MQLFLQTLALLNHTLLFLVRISHPIQTTNGVVVGLWVANKLV